MPANAAPSTTRARPAFVTALICAVLFTGTALLFTRALGYEFLNYDDPAYVTDNEHVKAPLTWGSVVWAFTGHADYWHPLSWLSHMVDWQLYGPNAAGHRLTSLLWHAMNAMLAFLVFRRLTGALWTSGFGAALFAWHPLRVESVVWITERKDLMSGFFFLFTLWAYTAYAESARGTAKAKWRYALALGCFALGLMSKPMLVSLPLVLLCLDFWPLRRAGLQGDWRGWRPLLIEKVPFVGLSLAVSIVTVRMQEQFGWSIQELPLGVRLGNAVVSVARYLGKFFGPFDLVVCYPHPGGWPALAVIGAVALLIAITIVAWTQRTGRPWILAGWVWLLVMLAPVIGVVQAGFQAMADRYTYLPMLGWQMACLWTLREFAGSRAVRMVLALSGAAVLVACGVRTWEQEAVWRDPFTLFGHAVSVDDRNEVAHGFLGYSLAISGYMSAAEVHARRALELKPSNTNALLALAAVERGRGNVDAAVQKYLEVLAVMPDDYSSELELGELLLGTGRTDEAKIHLGRAAQLLPGIGQVSFRRAMHEMESGRPADALVRFEATRLVDPGNAAARYWCGDLLAGFGRADEALGRFQEVLVLQPDHSGARLQIGLIELARGNAALAEVHFRAVIAANPNAGMAHLGLARASQRLGRPEEAMESFRRAVQLLPDDPVAHQSFAEFLARSRRFDEAARAYERALQLEPRNAEVRAAYGFVLVLTGRRADAIREWEEALRLNPNLPGLRERLAQLLASGGG